MKFKLYLNPIYVVRKPNVDSSLIWPRTALSVTNDPTQVPLISLSLAVEGTTTVSLASILATLNITSTNLELLVVVGSATFGLDRNLSLHQVHSTRASVTQVTPTSSFASRANGCGCNYYYNLYYFKKQPLCSTRTF